MRHYYRAERRGPYFEGWYFKHQGTGGGLAIIPAIHVDSRGDQSASIQLITAEGSQTVRFPVEDFCARKDLLDVRVGSSQFSRKGVWLDLCAEGLTLRGELCYSPLTPLHSDIMGPFRCIPCMECSHGVLSMGHRVEGTVTLNGTALDFTGGTGYIETDRGRSFPKEYLWTQCTWKKGRSNSLMMSIAHIPMLGGGFTGCICAVLYGGKEYRLATYRGARAECWSAQGAVLRQGAYRLSAELLSDAPQPLLAPVTGCMTRVIHESLFAAVRYRFWKGDTLLFDHIDERASFEYSGKRAAAIAPLFPPDPGFLH